jgi:hypothetical protein
MNFKPGSGMYVNAVEVTAWEEVPLQQARLLVTFPQHRAILPA